VRLVLALQQQILVPGEVSVAQGENGSIMYFVSRGALSVTILTENGSTVNIARLTDGDYFGEAAILDNGVRNATVRAETFAELYFLTRAAFLEAISSNRGLYDTVLRGVRRRKAQASLSTKLRTLRVKLCAVSKFMLLAKRRGDAPA